MKGAEENIKGGMLQFCSDIKEQGVTNIKLSKYRSDLSSRGPLVVIPSTHFSYQKVQIVNVFYS